jgi:glycosyltransferase 2 family protein
MPDRTEPGAAASPRRRPSLLDWRAGLGIGLSFVLLYFAFRNTNFREVWVQIRTIDPLLLLLATALCTFVFWIRAWRWKAILQPVKPDIPFRSRFASVTIGFMGNNLLPARIGEFMRAYSLSRQEAVTLVASFASLVLERLFDGMMVTSLLFLAMRLPDFPPIRIRPDVDFSRIASGAGVVVVVAFAVLLLLVLFPRPAVRGMEQVVQYLPKRVRRPIIDALEAFLTGGGILRSPLLVSRAVFWSIVLWLVNAAGFYCAFLAFDIDLPFTAALFFQSCIALAVSAPSGPGFFGIYHFAATKVLVVMWGVEQARAAAYAITYHLAGFIPVTLIGLYYAWRIGLSMGEVKGSEETVEDAVEQATGSDVIIERRRHLR